MDSQSKKHDLTWLFIILGYFILRLPTLYTQILDVDETQFAGFAHVLMDGGLPFRDSLDTKPLGIYWFYQLIFTIFGRFNMTAVHLATTASHLGVSFFIYKIFQTQKLKQLGYVAATFFLLASTTFIPKYLSTSINSIMIFFLSLSGLLFSLSITKKSWLSLITSGLVLGVALLFKYTAGIQIFLVPLFFISSLIITKADFKAWIKKALQAILFGLMVCVPFILHGLYLKHIGVWDDFYYWSLMGSGKYISQGSQTISPFTSFLSRFLPFALASLPIWIGALLFFKNIKENLKSPIILFFGIWTILSLVPVFVGARFYPHYFLHALPALSGLATITLFKNNPMPLIELIRGKAGKYLLISASLFFILRLNYPLYLTYFPDDQIYQQQHVGEILKTKANADDKIFVWGFATGIYFHSELKPSSRFLWADLLCGRTPGPWNARKGKEKEKMFSDPVAWLALFEDFDSQPPAWIIDTSTANIHDYGRFPLSHHEKLAEYIKDHYVKVDPILGVDIYRRR